MLYFNKFLRKEMIRLMILEFLNFRFNMLRVYEAVGKPGLCFQ